MDIPQPDFQHIWRKLLFTCESLHPEHTCQQWCCRRGGNLRSSRTSLQAWSFYSGQVAAPPENLEFRKARYAHSNKASIFLRQLISLCDLGPLKRPAVIRSVSQVFVLGHGIAHHGQSPSSMVFGSQTHRPVSFPDAPTSINLLTSPQECRPNQRFAIRQRTMGHFRGRYDIWLTSRKPLF
jgi:hypothetical protein